MFEGRMWFLRDFQFLLPERKPRFCTATAKMVEFLKVRLWPFSPSNFAFERTGAGPPGGRVITLEQRAAGMKNHAMPWEKAESTKASFAGPMTFWQIWTSTSCLRGACGFCGIFSFCFQSENLGFA